MIAVWLEDWSYGDDCEMWCSNCGARSMDSKWEHYCPECGAEMYSENDPELRYCGFRPRRYPIYGYED